MAAPTSPHVAAATQSPLPATAATEAAPSEERSGEVAALSAGRTLQNAPADYLASGVAEGAPVAAEPAAPPAGEPSERAATADAPLSPTAASGTSTQGVRAELMRQPTTVTAPSPAAGAAAAPAASTSSKARRASKSAAGQARRTPPSDAAASPRQQQFAALEAAAVAAPHDQQHRGGPKPVKDADYEWVHELTTTDRFFKVCAGVTLAGASGATARRACCGANRQRPGQHQPATEQLRASR